MCLTNFASTKYAHGEIRVVAYDSQGSPAMEKSVKTSGKARALVLTANGDPTCLMPFQNPEMKLFSGAATAIARSGLAPGSLRFKVSAKGVKGTTVEIPVK